MGILLTFYVQKNITLCFLLAFSKMNIPGILWARTTNSELLRA